MSSLIVASVSAFLFSNNYILKGNVDGALGYWFGYGVTKYATVI